VNPLYAHVWKTLRHTDNLEKVAGEIDASTSAAVQVRHSEMCDGLFRRLKRASEALGFPGGLRGKEASAAKVACLLLDIRNTHTALGEKVAASPDTVADLATKLTTAAFVDDVLTEQLEKAAAADDYEGLVHLRGIQLLGREYAVSLMRGLLQ